MQVRRRGSTRDGRVGAAAAVAAAAAAAAASPQPFISFSRGQNNIPGPSADPIRAVEDAFACIARLGTAGCGFEQPLEAALRALDPRLSVNPGFRRDSALLVVVFLGDEDDCSARDGRLFEPAQEALGPLTSFRCFEFGVTCDENDRTAPGVRSGCAPSAELLYPVAERYERFFRAAAPPGRALLAAFVGPPDPVEVQVLGRRPVLKESCASAAASAAPAVRIASLIDSFAPDSQLTSICEPDFGPPLAALGEKIRRKLASPCFPWPLLTANGGLACQAGDAYGPGLLCEKDCLQLASCDVVETVGQGTSSARTVKIERCPLERWYPADWQQQRDCGALCPCWRIVRKGAACDAALGETPYGLDILRRERPSAGAIVDARCFSSPEPWSGDGAALAHVPQCE